MPIVRFLGDNTGYKVTLPKSEISVKGGQTFGWVAATKGAQNQPVLIDLRKAYLIEEDQ